MIDLFKKRNTKITLSAPISGEIVELEEVPDPIFAEKMIGDGIAIKPIEGKVVSPCDGKVIQVFPTKHAISILTKEGIEILIHIGIDTVTLKGEGFKSFVANGDNVFKGDKLLDIDLDYITDNGKSTITPILITNMDKVKKLNFNKGKVETGKTMIMEIIV